MRRFFAWSSTVSLVLCGTLVAHTFAYRLAYPVADVRLRMLAQSGHGYMGYLPLVLGLIAATLLATSVVDVVDFAHGRPARRMPAAAFAVLPPLAYTAQEFIERWVHVGVVPWWMVLQPSFRYGLALQVPFGLLAYVVTRLLLRVARRVALGFARPEPVVTSLHWRTVLPAPTSVARPRLRLAVSGWTLRGPPELGSFS